MNFDTLLLLGSMGIPCSGICVVFMWISPKTNRLKNWLTLCLVFPALPEFLLFLDLILQMDIVLNSFMNVWDFMNLALLSILD